MAIMRPRFPELAPRSPLTIKNNPIATARPSTIKGMRCPVPAGSTGLPNLAGDHADGDAAQFPVATPTVKPADGIPLPSLNEPMRDRAEPIGAAREDANRAAAAADFRSSIVCASAPKEASTGLSTGAGLEL